MGSGREAKHGVGKHAAHDESSHPPAVGKSTLSGSLPGPQPDAAPASGEMCADPLAGVPQPAAGAAFVAERAHDGVALALDLARLGQIRPDATGAGVVDLGKYARLFGNGTAVRGDTPALAHYDATTGTFTLVAPAVQLDGLRAPGFAARDASLRGVMIRGRVMLSPLGVEVTSAAFTTASVHTCAISAAGHDVYLDAIELTGGTIATSGNIQDPAAVQIQFARATIRNASTAGAPPVDVTIHGGSLIDIKRSVGAAPPSASLGPLALPKAALDGTRILVDIERPVGAFDMTADRRRGGLRRLSAQLVRSDTASSGSFPEVLASIALENVSVLDAAGTSGSIGKLRVSGTPSFVQALLDSAEVRALPDVGPVVDQIAKLGLVPAAGASVALDHVSFGSDSGGLGVHGDLAVDLDVPGLGTLHVALQHGRATSSGAGDAAGGTLTVSARDGRGPIAELVADGVGERAGGDTTVTLKRVRATGDIPRLLRAADKITLPPRLAAALQTVRSVDLGAGASADELKTTLPAGGGVSIELAGDGRAWLDAGGVGGVDVSVRNAHVEHAAGAKTTVGSVQFDRFEAHLAPRARPGAPPREAASIAIDGARADNTRSPAEVVAKMIDVRGDTAAIQSLAAALRREAAGLPPLVKHALDVVRRLDLDGARAMATGHQTKEPAPDWNASTGAKVALVLPGGGRLGATLAGFTASHRRDSVVADFESLELTLDDATGKRAARLAVRGGHGYVQDADRGGASGAMDVGAQLDDIVADGNTTRLLAVLDTLPGAVPGSLATALSFVRQHRQALAATGRVRAQHLELARIDGRVDATVGPITARVALPHAVLVATLTGARSNEDDIGFDTLEFNLGDGAATVRLGDATWRPNEPATIGSVSAHGNLPKLAPVLDDKTLAMLPPTVASAIRATHGTVATLVGRGVAIDPRGGKLAARADVLDLRADLAFTHDGKQYEARGAVVKVFGGRTELDEHDSPSAIAADHVHVLGTFSGPVGGKKVTGRLELRTGEATLRRGGGAMRLECRDLRASGQIDAPAGAAPDDHRIVEHDQLAATAVELAPLLRDLELDTHTPIDQSRVAPKQDGSRQVGEGILHTTIAPGTQLDLHVRAANGTMSQIEAIVTPPISLYCPVRGLAVLRGHVSVDLGGFIKLATPVAKRTAEDWVGASVEIPKLVEHVAGKLRENLVEEIHAKDNLAVEPGLVEKVLGPLKRDLMTALAKEETTGTGRARLSGQIPRLDLAVDSQVSGRIDHGRLQLRGAGAATWGSDDGGLSRVEIEGLGVDTSLPGARVSFDGLRMDRFVWFDLSK